MIYQTLISVDKLARHLEDPKWVIVDCRFSLSDTDRGQRDYVQAHIPGAIYAHLDHDLSGPVNKGQTGRHPLPTVERAAQVFSSWGIEPGMQVVAYDDAGGALAAGRLWWMLRWLGHDEVAVLDGGWQRWLREGKPTASGEENRSSSMFVPHPRPKMMATTTEVRDLLGKRTACIVDARTVDRYRGENEIIDPVAGHIPGAINLPYPENLTPTGVFRSPEELRQIYLDFLGDFSPEQAIFYCGSGVTSIHNILAMVHAGLPEARLYAGSWSEWITDPTRPVVVGEG
jgi:thiosulfate/3-mercaptopyruvate sulfurtransferase